MKLTELLPKKISFLYQILVKIITAEPKNKQKQPPKKTITYKKASLFVDGKTNIAALSIVMRGVAEILSQKMDLPWSNKGTLSYEKQVSGGKGICYYVTDHPEKPHPEILAEEAALAVIDKFDPRACAIHLIYCALTANLEPGQDNFIIDQKQLLEYTGLNKRRDLSKHEQLFILYHLSRQPAQILASVAQSKPGKEGVTVADIQIWDLAIIRDVDTDENGNNKLIGLKVIGKPGAWTKYFLNESESYRRTGIITKKTVQKLFSIGKQNAGAARLLIWLTFQIQPGYQDCVSGRTLMEIAYGEDRVALAQKDRQLRRQLADDLETDLKAVKEAEWQVELENEPAWLKDNHTKRPIGFWDELLNTKWHFDLSADVQHSLMSHQQRIRNIQPKSYIQPPSGNLIREARKAKGWCRADFAALMGKSVSWVDAIETGHRQVSQKDLPKLLNMLELN